MLVLISDYNTDTFNKLLSFKEAGLKFDSFDGGTFIADIMAPLFPKHRVENVLGLQLLHRHFTLQPGERLVDFNGTSVPIKPEGDPASNLTTTIWDLEQSGDQLQLHPLEFMFIQALPIWPSLFNGPIPTFRSSSPLSSLLSRNTQRK